MTTNKDLYKMLIMIRQLTSHEKFKKATNQIIFFDDEDCEFAYVSFDAHDRIIKIEFIQPIEGIL